LELNATQRLSRTTPTLLMLERERVRASLVGGAWPSGVLHQGRFAMRQINEFIANQK